MIKYANKGKVQMAKLGRPRKPGKLIGLAGLGSPKPAKNPSVTAGKNRQFSKPITLPKTGVKRDV